MTVLYIVSGLLLAASVIADRKKTLKALKIALKKFLKIAPAFVMMLILISLHRKPYTGIERVMIKHNYLLNLLIHLKCFIDNLFTLTH